ncbi:MAG: serine/threonine-protein phosphatase [Gammaproteobacteria bacterium]|nr:serine/threonine-protein phosphatase [Gammaproteobacteria bacterium]
MSIISSGLTDTGHVRKRNEDSFLDLAEQNLWVVADGMGGHDAGDFASQAIVSYLSTFTIQESLAKSVDLIEDLIIKANKDIQRHVIEIKVDKTKTSGSTVVGLFIWKNIGITFWSGDSRLYRVRDSLERISVDHSYVEELVKLGHISADEAEEHPSANVILNAIGIKETPFLDLDYFKIDNNDIFILCSYGLYKDLNEKQLSQIVDKNKHEMDNLAKQLLDRALEAGGSDNTSIICIQTNFEENNDV